MWLSGQVRMEDGELPVGCEGQQSWVPIQASVFHFQTLLVKNNKTGITASVTTQKFEYIRYYFP